MKALILNSGLGHRMGVLTSEHPKCMTEISGTETILSRQLKLLADAGIRRVVMTTGYCEDVLRRYCRSLNTGLEIDFVQNPRYDRTNYIYSVYLARDLLRDDDLLVLHGDLVFENSVLDDLLACAESRMTVSSVLPLPKKDFKAMIPEDRIRKIGVNVFESAVAAQPMYRFKREDLDRILDEIAAFCERGETGCYAEEAMNVLLGRDGDAPVLLPLDVKERLCAEIDTPEDLERITAELAEIENRKVYMCFSADMIYSAHIALIRKAEKLGRLTIGVLSDEAVASYKRFPLLPFAERRIMSENIAGVDRVVEQRTLSYRENLEKYRPDYVVHGDDWVTGLQQPIRQEVMEILESYGGKLVEYPYAKEERYRELEYRARRELSMPDLRRARLRKLLAMKGMVTALEAHSGLTGLIVEKTVVGDGGGARQFDAMWISSLCDSTAKGKPDIELVDMSSRFRTVDDICEVTTKPIIFDGDTGGLTEHFVYTVRSLERMGVSMVIIEDKTGLKKNSLFGTEVPQTQDEIGHFCEKITAGKQAQRTKDFMICARIESLILEKGLEDALTRAFAYTRAGADAVMIHSRKKDPSEIFAFVERFRAQDSVTPLVVVPTSFNEVTEEEFRERGVNIVIYANQLTRSGFPAMRAAAESILTHHRAKECDGLCMPFGEIIRLIPEE